MNEALPPELEFGDIDLHFARLMSRMAQSDRAELALAAALASRATREGDVCVRLTDYETHAPPLDQWIASLRDTRVVGAPGEFTPLVLDDAGRLYLYRYWDYEKRLAEDLLARAETVEGVDDKLLRKGLDRFFPDAADWEQKLAAATAVLRRFCVISGGPGTGKTTTVVKILALLADQARDGKLQVRLAAPTGKAAARVQDAVRTALAHLNLDLFADASMPNEAFTIHRLLGPLPESVYFRHDRENPLALDVLVIDEASMADLALAAKLLDALPPRARLILLGDKDQLASVETGAVLGDICAASGYTAAFAKRLGGASGIPVAKIAKSARPKARLADSVALLNTSYRFGPESGIGTLARLVNAGQGSEALALLGSGDKHDIAWRTVTRADLPRSLAAAAVEGLRNYFDAVRAKADPLDLFERFNAFRVLCAHRTGPFGVATLNRVIEDALDNARLIDARDRSYAGRPIMIARNDYNLRLFNGDVGIMLPGAGGDLKAYFAGADGVRAIAPARLPEHETVYAMTVHKSQGSEFERVLVVLPDELSPVMSRELVYTAITRAKGRVEVWGNEAVFCDAIGRRMVRASALAERLWDAS